MSGKLNFYERKKKKQNISTLNKKLIHAVKNGLPEPTEQLLAIGANANLEDRVIFNVLLLLLFYLIFHLIVEAGNS